MGPAASGRGIVEMELRASRGHASEHWPKSALVVAGGDTPGLLECAGEVLPQCEVRQASVKAPNLLVAGTSSVSSFSEKLSADLLFLGDTVALNAMDAYST